MATVTCEELDHDWEDTPGSREAYRCPRCGATAVWLSTSTGFGVSAPDEAGRRELAESLAAWLLRRAA